MDLYNDKKVRELYKLIKESKNIVFFGGAGVSVGSGIPDFRSANGLYNSKYNYMFSPEDILSRTFFDRYPEMFYRFYKEKMIYLDALPNDAHRFLSDLEKMGKLKAVITQNIDGLHQKAGSEKVLELHGTIYKNYCVNCLRDYDIDVVLNNDIPKCECGGIIKPKVVLYEEALDEEVIYSSIDYIRNCDLFIIGGTSLAVYPASGLVRYVQNGKIAIINKEQTAFDNYADIVINDDICKVFKCIHDLILKNIEEGKKDE